MSRATLEKQIQSLPEDCLDEVTNYIESVLLRRKARTKTNQSADLSEFFGGITGLADGMDFQRRARDEWN
ncbi:MAG: hypothetical protein IJP92_04860 [Lachnospiraceae bacterium]|nr:hypothetical protein [Lachnospiraceae bacterium]